MKARIGYLIPEFPGQTHIFFWREREALAELGIETVLISTRRPPKAIASHSWASEAERQTVYLAPLARKDALNAALMLLKAGPIAWLRCLAVIVKAKDVSLKQRVRLLALMLVAAKLVKIAQARGLQHIHVHSCADAANVTLFAACLSNLTYSLTLHGPTLTVYGSNQAQKWQQAAFAIVISNRLLNEVNQALAGSLPPKVAIAPMGVNLDEIKRQTPYTPPEASGLCRLFSCGRLNPVKGHADLIQVVANLREQGFNIHLQIAGEDEQGGTGYHQELEKLILDKSLSEHVELLGAVSEASVRQGLEKAHLFALASLNEGVPVAVMEAMAMEVPIVVTDVGGTSELVEHGMDGILVQPEDPTGMTAAIVQVLQDQDLALRLSKASRQKIAANFSHRRSAEVLADCLQAVWEVSSP